MRIRCFSSVETWITNSGIEYELVAKLGNNKNNPIQSHLLALEAAISMCLFFTVEENAYSFKHYNIFPSQGPHAGVPGPHGAPLTPGSVL